MYITVVVALQLQLYGKPNKNVDEFRHLGILQTHIQTVCVSNYMGP